MSSRIVNAQDENEMWDKILASVPQASMTEKEAIDYLHSACFIAGSQRNFARKHGFSDAFIADVLHGKRRMSKRLAKALDLQKEVRYYHVTQAEKEQK